MAGGYQMRRVNGEGRGEGAVGPRGGVDVAVLRERVGRLLGVERQRYQRLWTYYRNPMRVCGVGFGTAVGEGQGSERPYRQGQEWGLPSRITGVRAGQAWGGGEGVGRKEVVIENDIGWRIETMVDYLFGQPVVIASAAGDEARREEISELLRMVLARNGGIVFLQQLALLGAVYGFVDVVVKCEGLGVRGEGLEGNAEGGMQSAELKTGHPHPGPLPEGEGERGGTCGMKGVGEGPVEGDGGGRDGVGVGSASPAGEGSPDGGEAAGREGVPGSDSSAGLDEPGVAGASGSDSRRARLSRLARMIRLEIVEPARALPFLSCEDYRVIEGYGQVWEEKGLGVRGQGLEEEIQGPSRWWERWFTTRRSERSACGSDRVVVSEIITASRWWRYEGEVVVAGGVNSLGRVPVVHIQNSAVPFEYSGASDVELLIPLQDELNTRLSDRANRIAMQSFKMYLGKGIENFLDQPVGPGRMWMTENESAEVVEFGGDAACPSEDRHIAELREAMDKVSCVSPVAAGVIQGRIGNLTSAVALKITMLSLLAKTERKRTTYGAGVEQICELALAWLDAAGVYRTEPEERRVELHWPSPLPENEMEKLQEAEAKVKLGVGREVALRELGY